jgi:hypothetical protein
MFGFPFSLSTTCFSARVMGGCGFTTPSSQRTPTFSFLPLKNSSSFHGNGSKVGSLYQGFASMIVLMNNLQPSRLVDRGPMVGTICSSPSCVAVNPLMGRRPEVGFMPYTPACCQKLFNSLGMAGRPLFAAGLRIDPPMSVPMPKQLPRNPTRAPSPPEEPPAVSVVLKGFVVTLYPVLAQRNTLLPHPSLPQHTHKDCY